MRGFVACDCGAGGCGIIRFVERSGKRSSPRPVQGENLAVRHLFPRKLFVTLNLDTFVRWFDNVQKVVCATFRESPLSR